MSLTISIQPKIPQELIDLIVDEISLLTYSERLWARLPASLRSCLLVSTSFCTRARFHLFRNVKFKSHNPSLLLRELGRFLDLLQSPSNQNASAAIGGHIAPLVKTFGLAVTECRYAEEMLPLFNNLTFTSVLQYFSGETYGPSMVRFYIKIQPPLYIQMSNRLNWELLSISSQVALLVLFQSPNLEAIHLYGFENLPSNFLDGSLIKHLEILNSHCSTPSSTVHLKAISSQLQLESIHATQAVPIDHLTSNGIPITSNLKDLDIYSDSASQDDNTWRIIDATSHSLKRLRVQFGDHKLIINRHLKFLDLIALEELSIHIEQSVVHGRPSHSSCDNDIIELCVLLCDPSSRCPLHTINISIGMTEFSPKPGFFDPDLTSNWVLLDKALSNTNFLSLRKVSLCFDFIIIHEENVLFEKNMFMENAKASLKRVFPATSTLRSIDFVIKTDVGRTKSALPL